MDESKAKKVETEEDSLVIETRTALELDPSKVFPAGHVVIHHIEITCDGCECEPIIGKRSVTTWPGRSSMFTRKLVQRFTRHTDSDESLYLKKCSMLLF